MCEFCEKIKRISHEDKIEGVIIVNIWVSVWKNVIILIALHHKTQESTSLLEIHIVTKRIKQLLATDWL